MSSLTWAGSLDQAGFLRLLGVLIKVLRDDLVFVSLFHIRKIFIVGFVQRTGSVDNLVVIDLQ